MLRLTELRLPLAHDADALRVAILKKLGIDTRALLELRIWKRSHDARKKSAMVFIYTVDCEVVDEVTVLQSMQGDPHVRRSPDTAYRFVAQAVASSTAVMDVGVHVGTNTGADAGAGADAQAGTEADAEADATGLAVGSGRGTGSAASPRPIVVGFGPCGIFAALLLAQMGLAPIVLERGKAARERTADTWGLWRRGVLDPESNVQFGEGGAGTFSDGKLWSQISDPRHLTRKVLDEFVEAGAPDEILYVGKPHIGTFRLVGVVEKMRASIVALGGEIRFGQRVTDLAIDDGRLHGLTVVSAASPDGVFIAAEHVVLCPGHSARDTFEMLHARGVHVEAKPFSIGFRIEHPQSVIDRARHGPNAGHALLGAADYRLVHHASNDRAVYSFCMCPGGTVVAATSEVGRVVTNGMSQYSRNERNANAGIVVGITPADFAPSALRDTVGKNVSPHVGVDVASRRVDLDVLGGIAFQRHWESRAFELGGGDYRAPGQRVGDFLKGKPSTAFGSVLPSYTPGVNLVDLGAVDRPAAPPFAIDAIREALPAFERQIKGFAMEDAMLTGIETRTSSPIRITRGRDRQSLNVVGLYPAGEGAGYAGGIMSAAVDGIETAEAVALAITGKSPHTD